MPKRYGVVVARAGPTGLITATSRRYRPRLQSGRRFGLLGGISDANGLALSLIEVFEGVRDKSILDQYAKERREIFLETTSPQATRYKRSMGPGRYRRVRSFRAAIRGRHR